MDAAGQAYVEAASEGRQGRGDDAVAEGDDEAGSDKDRGSPAEAGREAFASCVRGPRPPSIVPLQRRAPPGPTGLFVRRPVAEVPQRDHPVTGEAAARSLVRMTSPRLARPVQPSLFRPPITRLPTPDATAPEGDAVRDLVARSRAWDRHKIALPVPLTCAFWLTAAGPGPSAAGRPRY